MNVIGKNIREVRKSNGFTQAQLAEKAGISRSYLAGVEQDSYNPSVKTLLAIASACHADLNFLAGMTEKQVKIRRDA